MIDRDKLDKEGDRLQDWLSAHDPASEEYSFVQKRLTELVRLSLEVDDAHNKQPLYFLSVSPPCIKTVSP